MVSRSMPDGLVAVLTATEQASAEAPSEQRVAVRSGRCSAGANRFRLRNGGGKGGGRQHRHSHHQKSAAFLSHYKMQAGTEARLHGKLKEILGEDAEVFLDNDDLQTFACCWSVGRRMCWCCCRPGPCSSDLGDPLRPSRRAHRGAKRRQHHYGAALDFDPFDLEIDIANPGAANLLVEHGVDPDGRISTVLPSVSVLNA